MQGLNIDWRSHYSKGRFIQRSIYQSAYLLVSSKFFISTPLWQPVGVSSRPDKIIEFPTSCYGTSKNLLANTNGVDGIWIMKSASIFEHFVCISSCKTDTHGPTAHCIDRDGWLRAKNCEPTALCTLCEITLRFVPIGISGRHEHDWCDSLAYFRFPYIPTSFGVRFTNSHKLIGI